MKYKLLAFLLFSLFATQAVAQTVTNFSGTLTNSVVFKRPVPLTENYTMQLSPSDVTAGTVNYNYFAQAFTPATTGTYTVTVTGSSISDQDTFLIIYGSAFNAASPLSSFIKGNDDISEANLFSSVSGLSLTAGTTYYLVVTTYNPGQTGTVNFSVNGAGGIVVGTPPAITSATYVASTGVLTVTGTDFQAKTGSANDIVLTNLTLTGEGGSTYTLTNSTGIEITSATSFTTTLNATDKAGVNMILNKNGTSSTSATAYNLAAAAGWMANSTASADLTGNAITVSGVVAPTITSATYDASTGTFVVTGTGFLKKSGVTNDITANKFTFTGQGNATYTLTDSANPEITNGTTFSLVLSATDKTGVNLLLNKNGTSAIDATTYNLAAAEDWAAGAEASVNVADLSANGITVSNVSAANQAPTNIALTATTINENVAANTTVGTLSTTDPDAANTFTYSLVTGSGSTDNTSFSISGSSLSINASPNFEAKSSYAIRIRTTDQGGLTFEKAFTININNLNEAPTDIVLSATAVDENVAANTTVGTLSTTDADAANTFTYSLVTGTGSTDNTSFNISGNSLRITASPDFETKSSYSVRIRTADQGGLSFEKVFTITINDVNEAPSNNAPTDLALTSTAVNENVAANTTVGTLSTTDADAANTFTYSLVTGTGSTDNTSFSISGNSLSINASPDFETKSSYSIRIRTTDQGGLSFEKVFTININNLNEVPTNIALTSSSINENVAANTTVGTLSTTDPDAANTFTYSLVSGTGSTDNTSFNISGSSLRITASPDFETKSSYSVRVRTTDQGGLTFEKVFTITINDVNEAPSNNAPTDLALSATAINENVAANTAIGTLSTTDPDAANTFTYSLVSGTGSTDNTSFSISGASLSINASPDFETKSSYSIRIRTTDQGGLTFEKAFTININNLNEAPTDIALTTTNVNENVAANTTVGTLSTTDVDAANTFTYSLIAGSGSTDNTSFSISGSSLRITASPDFETKSSYSIRVRTADQGGLSFEKVFTININNLNEAPTDIALTSTAVNENVAANTTVGTLSTTDVDAANTFTYSLIAGTGSTDNASFSISGSSLRITASPDFETKSSYSIRVRTADQGGLSFEKVFTITINDVNEAPSNNAPTDIALSANAINENVAANTEVGTLSTTDADAANTFTYTLVAGTGDTDNSSFSIIGNSLKITSSPDFENKNIYSVRIRSTDQGGLAFTRSFAITINNVNEAPNGINLSSTSITENVAANTMVATLSPGDPDPAGSHTYTLVSGTGDTDNASFNISGTSLRFTGVPDYEIKNSYSIRLRVTDQDGLTFERTATITVTDVAELATVTTAAIATYGSSTATLTGNVSADNGGTISEKGIVYGTSPNPTIISGTKLINGSGTGAISVNASSLLGSTLYHVRAYATNSAGTAYGSDETFTTLAANTAPTDLALSSSSINENVAANSTVGALSTTDADAANTFTYSLVSGTGDTDNASFNISGANLRIGISPDFEAKNSYSVRVRTTDQGGLSFEKVFAININNLNEAPTDLALSSSSINENVAANSTVGTLSTTDVDAANTFTYSLVTGTGSTDNTSFSISGNSLSINVSPDFEAKSSYSVRVRTADQGGLSFEKVFTININNLNEVPTDLALSSSSINENLAANSTVGTLSTTDVDAANTFTYSLVTGTGSTDNTSFNISGNSLSINASPDFEAKSSYSVRVRTADQGGLSFEKVFTISINNLNEVPTDLALSSSSINENVAANSTVGALSTTDADAANTFTYSLVAGTGDTDNASFNISGANLRIGISPDFEAKSSYSVRVRTADQGGLSFEKVFTININNLNEVPTDLALSSSSINENVAANSTVGALSTTDVDAANTFTYSLVTGTGSTDNTSFNISGNSLSINVSPDFEAKSSYSVRVRTADQGGLSFEKVFTININNLNEVPTNIALSASAINENVAANSTVGTLSTTDVDAANTFTYSLVAGTGDTDNASFNISGANLRIGISPDFEAKGSYSVRVRTADQGGLSFEKVFTITINDIDEVVLATTSVPNPLFGTVYSETISATGGTTPYSFAITTGALPSGLTLSTAGVLNGTATNSGTFNFAVTVTAMNGTTATRSYSMNIAAPTLVIAPSSLANATVNAAYSQSISTTAGTAPYTYSITAGALPTGLSLSTSGQLSGTPTVGGTYTFTVKAIDASVGAGPYNNTITYSSFVVQPAVQTITLAPTASATYGDADIDPSATSTNQTIGITYTTSDNTIASIVNNKVHILKAGTVTIYANQASSVSYIAAAQKQQTLTIGQKALTASITGTISKTYDANANISLSAANFTLSGKVGTDDVSIAVPAAASYDNGKVGTAKTVNVSGLSLAGTTQSNYVLTATTATANIGVITTKPITLALNASPVITKVYNSNNTASLATANYSLTGVENGDVVSVTGSATYNDKNVGTGKVITANTFVLAGADKANYNLTTTTANTTGVITTKPITLSLNASPLITKVYNANNAATLVAANYSLAGVESGDVVSVTGTSTFDNKNIGTGKTVTANTFVLSGADQANYNLTTTTASTTGAITAKPITLALNNSPVISKVYNANNAATLVAANYSLTGVESGDVVNVTGTTTYDNKNIGTSKTVTANTLVLSGADQANYNLTTTTASTTGAITAKPITLALNSTPVISKVYNASNLATLVAGNYSLSGVESGDLVNVAGTAAYADKKVGTVKAITVNTFVLSGTDQANYSLTTTTASTSGNITAKPITLSLNAAPLITKVYNGNNAALLATGNYTFAGVESGDVVTVSSTATYDNQNTGTGKTVTANTFVLSGTDKDNYNLTTSTATTTGAVTKAALIITAENKTKPQNTANPVFTATYQGFVNSETSAVLTTLPVYSTTAVLASLPGNYPITPSGAAGLNYSFTYVDGVLNVKPGTPTSLTLAQSTLFENRAVGTLTGTLSSTSDDPLSTFTYALVSGTGDTDNSLFSIAGNNINTASVLNYEAKSSYSVRVRTTTGNGLSLEQQLTILLSDVNEQPTFDAITNQVLCADGSRQAITLTGINAGPEPGQTTSFTVSSNNASLFGELSITNGGLLNYKSANGQSGTATVTVTVKDNGGTANGGVDSYSRTFTITVNPLPVVAITTPDSKIEISKGESLVLTASGGVSYAWSGAQGIIGATNAASLSIRPDRTTTYTVVVTSAFGCTSTKQITITVIENIEIVKGTNLLTPNGDGKNDNFIIRNIDMYPNNEVKIFDRAGRLLYSKVNYKDEWNGTFQGSPLAEGVYYYIVDFGDRRIRLKGFITIVRD